MAYQIDKFNGEFLTVVEDGTINQTTSLKLVGKNYAGYGEIQNENFVHLLESFARTVPPERPLAGQVWFDATAGAEKLKFYDGSQWKTTGGAEVSNTAPVGLTDGDFWWDTSTEQLYAKGSTGYVLIGPQATGSGNVTQMRSAVLKDTNTPAINHDVILGTVGNDVITILAKESFQIATEDSIPGFSTLSKGLNLIGENFLDFTDDFKFQGTATSADGLLVDGQVIAASQFLQQGLANFGDTGYTLGDDVQKLKVKINEQNTQQAQIIFDKNGTSANIAVAVRRSNEADINAAEFVYTGINPGHSSSTLGVMGNEWSGVYANNFWGLAEKATGIANPDSGVTGPDAICEGSFTKKSYTTALRDVSGNITAEQFIGTATQARYADLAEKYTTETLYTTGTVVAVCAHKEHEMALANVGAIVAGVISDNPAYLMNAESDGQAVALKGRVPVKVIGAVKKGEPVFVFQDGITSVDGQGEIVGVALESNDSAEEKLVECFLKV